MKNNFVIYSQNIFSVKVIANKNPFIGQISINNKVIGNCKSNTIHSCGMKGLAIARSLNDK
jgi:hypothetical protein